MCIRDRYKIANLSNGKVFYPDDIRNLLKDINESERNRKIIHSKEKLEAVINIPWILLSLLMLIFIEWFVRKYNGLT